MYYGGGGGCRSDARWKTRKAKMDWQDESRFTRMQGKSLKLKKLKQPAVLSERTSALAINFAYTKVSNNSSKEIASPNICDRPPNPPPSPPPPYSQES